MPLYPIDSDIPYTKVPHEKDNRPTINKLKENELDAIISELNRLVDEAAGSKHEVLTSSWIPGNDWTGTVYAPIYYACNESRARSAMIFGAILFEVMMNRPEDWASRKYNEHGRYYASTRYFRIGERKKQST